MDVIQNTADTVSVVLLNTSDVELTGLVDTDITLYYRKDGGAATAKVIDNSNFREVDAVNMPGLYELDFTAADFDTAGEFAFVIAANVGVSLAQKNVILNVLDEDDTNLAIRTSLDAVGADVTRILGLSQDNVRITGQTYDLNNNLTGSVITIYPTAADVVNQTNAVGAYSLTAAYDSQNRLIDYRIERTS